MGMMSTLLLMRPAASLQGTTRLLSHTDDPGGDIDDPGGGSTNAWNSFSNFTTSASTCSRASASYVSSSLTARVSSLSLSDRSTADVVECAEVDYATGSFCSSCSIPPPMAHGFWSSGKGYLCYAKL